MPVYLVVLAKRPELATTRIEEFPASDRYRLKADVWVVDYDGTTRALAEKIGIRGTSPGGSTGVVFPVSNYSGRAATEFWEWMKIHMNRADE
jgi:hypothetical protein